MEFKELIAKRRSVRKFTDREVPREVVDRILAEALSAPSARNTRTTRFLVVDDPVLVARMDELGMDKTNYEWYLNLRKFGGVEHAGYGLGFERMIMYLTGIQNIRDVLPFPRTAYGF